MPVDSAVPLSAVHLPRLSDLAFERLADAIVRGDIAPGEMLSDRQLAERLGVSRMPVREAIQRLEGAGLVETAASRYTRVARITPELARDTVEYAGYVYGAIARMAVLRMTDDELATALELMRAAEAVMHDGAQYLETGAAVTRHLLGCCRNDAFDPHSGVFLRLRWLIHHGGAPAPTAQLRGLQAQLIRAVADRDADGAERVVRQQYGIAVFPTVP